MTRRWLKIYKVGNLVASMKMFTYSCCISVLSLEQVGFWIGCLHHARASNHSRHCLALLSDCYRYHLPYAEANVCNQTQSFEHATRIQDVGRSVRNSTIPVTNGSDKLNSTWESEHAVMTAHQGLLNRNLSARCSYLENYQSCRCELSEWNNVAMDTTASDSVA